MELHLIVEDTRLFLFAVSSVAARSNSGRVNHGQQHFFVTLMMTCAVVAQPAFVIVDALGADLGGRFSALIAIYGGRFISR